MARFVNIGAALAGLIFIFLACISILTSIAQAEDIWTVDRDYAVYDDPEMESNVLGNLHRGQKVRVLEESELWKKISVTAKGEKVLAFVHTSKQSSHGESKAKSAIALGVLGGLNYAVQNGRTVTDTDGASTNIGTLTGTAPIFGAFGDYIFESGWTLRLELAFRSFLLKGSAQYVSNIPTAISTVEIVQQFTSLNVLVYREWSNHFMAGAGFELAMASKSTVLNVAAEKPTYFIAQVAGGYRLKFGDFFLNPEIRAGAIVNSKPFIALIDGLMLGGLEF